MLKNYFKIAFRNLIHHKGYSFINIAGLATGMACCILILLWVQDELSYDKFHRNADRIHLLGQWQSLETGRQTLSSQQAPVGPLIKDRCPEVEDFARFFFPLVSLHYGETACEEPVVFADPSVLTMFDFPLIRGNRQTALDNPLSVVISPDIAQKYFGDRNPMGKIIRVDNQYDVEVTGMLEPIPHNSSMEFDVVFPFELLGVAGVQIDEWMGADYTTYLLLHQDADIAQLTGKIRSLMDEHDRVTYGRDENPYQFFMHPLKRLHLYSISGEGGLIEYVYILLAATLFILVVACINFINLATARSTRRGMEIGLRKVFGAQRTNLIRQILFESFFMVLVSLLVALMLAEVLLPWFNQLAGKEYTLDIHNTSLVATLLAIGLFTGLLSGAFPALFLSGFRPARVLKGQIKSGRSGYILRRILVIIQFSISLILIIGTFIIASQIKYLNTKDLGLDKENIIYILASSGIKEHYNAFKNELLQHPDIINVTASAQGITHINSTIGNNWDFEGRNPEQRIELHFDWVATDYAATFGIQMAEGHFYSDQFPSDNDDGIILNETAINLMGIENPIGKRFSYWGNDNRIIGVVKDFHLEPLYETLKPMILIFSDYINYIYIRANPGKSAEALTYIEESYLKYEPNGIIDCRFLDRSYEWFYQGEARIMNIFQSAAILAIFIGCLGLFGLAAFAAEQRTKEIGIRKVLGATVTGIVQLLSKEFVILVLIANILAWPVAYYAMIRWLQNFAYRTEINFWLFILAGVVSLLIAIITVGFQSLRAATLDSVKSLRYE